LTDLSKDLAALRIPQGERGGRRSPIGLIAGVLVVIAVLATGGWYWTTQMQAVTVKVAPATAKAGGASAPGAVLNASGYVTARRRATVSSKVTGKVVDVLIEEGQPVKAGQILAHLDDTQPRASLAYAEAQLASSRKNFAEDQARLQQAELTLGRRQQLLKEGVVGKAELDQAQSDVDALKARIAYAQQQVLVAESQVNLQKTNLADMVVRAPFSGIAISKDAQPGEMISPVSAGGGFTRTGIGTIVDMSSLEIEVDVNETYINRVTPGSEGRGDPRRVPGLQDPVARHHDDSDGRPAEGHGEGPHRVRPSGPADPARHGREGVVPARRAGRRPLGPGGRERAGAQGGDSIVRRPVHRLRAARRPGGAPRGQRGTPDRRSDGSAFRCKSGRARGR
jgi:RND family efflux transporter MFP subunit